MPNKQMLNEQEIRRIVEETAKRFGLAGSGEVDFNSPQIDLLQKGLPDVFIPCTDIEEVVRFVLSRVSHTKVVTSERV